jgi:hypothetical protein
MNHQQYALGRSQALHDLADGPKDVCWANYNYHRKGSPEEGKSVSWLLGYLEVLADVKVD